MSRPSRPLTTTELNRGWARIPKALIAQIPSDSEATSDFPHPLDVHFRLHNQRFMIWQTNRSDLVHLSPSLAFIAKLAPGAATNVVGSPQ